MPAIKGFKSAKRNFIKTLDAYKDKLGLQQYNFEIANFTDWCTSCSFVDEVTLISYVDFLEGNLKSARNSMYTNIRSHFYYFAVGSLSQRFNNDMHVPF